MLDIPLRSVDLREIKILPSKMGQQLDSFLYYWSRVTIISVGAIVTPTYAYCCYLIHEPGWNTNGTSSKDALGESCQRHILSEYQKFSEIRLYFDFFLIHSFKSKKCRTKI
jgi:hypothetical protein